MKRGPGKQLSLFDSICIIVGIIVGAGIYETSPAVAAAMGGWRGVMGIWLAGGLLALCGALCYSELASTYPHQGGDYVYLNRAYGPWAGFLFGWSQLAIIRPGDIALMAFVFARYASALYAPFPTVGVYYASGAVIALTAINILGVRESKWTQDLLAVIKVGGLLFIVVVGLMAPVVGTAPDAADIPIDDLKLAMILVLFTYGGWNEMAYVAAEVKHPQKNIRRALVLGTVVVMVLYLLINGIFMHVLGIEGFSASDAVAVDAVAAVMPQSAEKVIGIIICISALGAVNGLIFTGARISYAIGTGHRVFRSLGRWNPRFGTPVAALVVQGVLSLGIVLVAGSFIDTILYSAPAVWFFFLATGLSLFRLRKKDAATPRPCKVPLYPAIPLVFCAACAFMLFSSATYALAEKPSGLIVLGSVLVVGGLVKLTRA